MRRRVLEPWIGSATEPLNATFLQDVCLILVTMRIVFLLAMLASFVFAWMPGKAVGVKASYDVYITVGKGADGEDGPLEKIAVTLSGPGEKINPQTKSTDSEGAVKFTVQEKGRYFVNIKAAGFEPYEGRAFVEKSPTYYLAGLVPPKNKPDKARIAVTVKDADSGWPIEGAAIKTQRDDESHSDHMTTGADGREYVVINLAPDVKGGLTFDVTVSHPDYESQTKRVTASKERIKDYPLEFSLKRARDLRVFAVTCLESGTRAPIQSAKVVVDGGRDKFFSQETGADGKAVFRLPPSATSYSVTVSTAHYEEHTDKINLNTESGVVQRTYELEKKDSAPEIRRGLIVSVRYKDDKGVVKPVKDAEVNGPGYHDSATDANGQILFLHTVPPGQTVTVTASKQLFKDGAATVLIRDKGVMVDMKQFNRDHTRGMSDLEAMRKQGVRGYDSVTIMLEQNQVESVKKVVGQIEAPSEANPGDPLSYSVKLNYEDGDSDVVTVDEVITVTDSSGKIVDRKGNIRTLNHGDPSSESYSFTPAKPGNYRIKCVVSWDRGVLWTGEATFEATEDRRKISVSGDVVAKKARVNLDERIDVNVNVLYASGPKERLNLRETVELFDPKGQVVQNNLGERSLNRGSYSLRNFAITCQSAGTYRLKSTILGPDGEVLWTGEDHFEVLNKGKSAMQKPGQGYYRLKNKILGHVPDAGVGQYGTISGSMSESSFTLTYEGAQGYDAHVSINLQYSVPPTVIKPNETIELTVQGSGSVKGKDIATMGIGGGWYVIGSGQVVESQKLFVGRASDGKDYNSGSAKFKIKVGQGGKLTIGNAQGGQTWGAGSDNWNPCTYEYEWVPNMAPPENKPGGKPTMEAGSATEKPASAAGAYSGTAVLARGDSIVHAVTMQIRDSGNPNTQTVTGSITSTVKGKGYQINLTGTYFTKSNKIQGKGTMVNLSKNSWDVTFSGSIENGQAAIIISLQQVGARQGHVTSAHLRKAG